MSDGNENDPIAGLNQVDQILSGTPFADTLGGQDGDESIAGGAGDDRLTGRGGNDSISGDDGNDLIRAGGGDDLLDGGDGDDVLWDGSGADRHFGGLGSDMLVGRDGADTLFGGDGFDRIYGGLDNDDLYGGGGTDYVYGGADNDTVTGGSGFDKLTGGEGADIFRVEAGSGRDVIRDFQPGADRIDVTDLALGLSFDHIVIRQMGPHTWVWFRGEEGLTLYNTDASSLSAADFIGLSQTSTASLRLIDRGDGDTLTAGDGDDYVRGSTGDNVLAGGAGNDGIWDGAGNDSLYGGDGDDRVRAGEGNDLLDGGGGSDRLDGGDGDDSMAGDLGDDFLFGGAGADTLDGGAGADILTGGAGADSFVAGEGGDVIRDFAPGEDTIDLSGRGVAFADLGIQASGPHTLISTPGGETILLFHVRPDQLSESDFTGLDGQAAEEPADDGNTITGTEGDDSLTGVAVDDIFGLAGNDTIDLRADFGSAFGGDGNDDVTIGLTPDSSEIAPAEAFGGAGDDTITVLDRDASAEGGDGNDLINVHDASFVDGGAGTDTLDYAGDGVAIYDASFREFPESPAGGYVVDGQTGSARGIESLGGGIVAGIIGGNGTSGDDVIGDDDVVQASSLGVSNMFAGAGDDTVYGFAHDDSIRGQFGDDLLFGGDGDDTLLGNAGNDTLDGGAGNNTLTGGDGADVFVLSLLGEPQTVTDFDSAFDTIRIDLPAEAQTEIELTQSGGDTVVTFQGLILATLLNVDASSISIDNFVVVGASQVLAGTDGDDDIRATGAEEMILGGAGDDDIRDTVDAAGHSGIIFGGDGNDFVVSRLDGGTIYGGEGNDTLNLFPTTEVLSPLESTNVFGGAGDDSIIARDDRHVLFGGEGNDTLTIVEGQEFYGGAGIDRLRFMAHDALIIVDEASDAFVGESGVYDLGDVETVEYTTLVSRFVAAGTHSDGQFSENSASAGDDIIADVIRDPNGQQRILAGDGNDRVYGFSHNDTLFGEGGVDTLFGGDGDDEIFGGNGFDAMYGGDGNDTLDGGFGASTLDGGTGDDVFIANLGREDFVFERSSIEHTGHDTIMGFDGSKDRLDVVTRLAADGVNDDGSLTFTHGSFGSTITFTDLAISDLTTDHAYDGGDLFGAGENGVMIFAGFGIHDRSGDASFEGTNANDILFGSRGEDTLLGLAGNDTLFGGDGQDALAGGGGDDLIFGGGRDSNDFDRHLGGAGNDTLIGTGSSKNTFIGGSGDDLIMNGRGDAHLTEGGSGNDTLLAGHGTGSMFGGDGADLFVFDRTIHRLSVIQDFESGVDRIDLSATGLGFEDLVIDDQGGSISIAFEDVGFIFLRNSNGLSVVESDFKFDSTVVGVTAIATDRGDDLFGSAGGDSLVGGAGSDEFYDQLGNDLFDGGDGRDRITYRDAPIRGHSVDIDLAAGTATQSYAGETYQDTLVGIEDATGSDGDDTISGDSNNNTLQGLGGADAIFGGAGDDTLIGGTGGNGDNDSLFGGEGDDRISDDVGVNLIDGGAGRDVLDYGAIHSSDTLNVDLSAGRVLREEPLGTSRDTISGIEDVIGGRGDDTITGDAGANMLVGGVGEDVVSGGAGDDFVDGGDDGDSVYGGFGNDTVTGGQDADEDSDRLFGGAGEDVFLLEVDVNRATDLIMDYEDGVDRIQVSDGGSGVFSDLSFVQSGDHVLVLYDGLPSYDDELAIIANTNADVFSEDDFIF